MLLAAAAMVLSVVDGRSGCSVVRSLGVGFIHLLSCVSSLASLALGRCVFPPKSHFAKRDSLVLQNETRFSEKMPSFARQRKFCKTLQNERQRASASS
jgi:hypothetical protein